MSNPATLLRRVVTLGLLAILAGGCSGVMAPASFPVASAKQMNMERAINDFLFIVKNNLKVLLMIIMPGVVSFGLYSVLVLVWNAYLIGFDTVSLFNTAPHECLYLLSYLPVEFLSLCCAASAASSLGMALFKCLFLETKTSGLWPSIRLLLFSFLLMVSAAVIETVAKVVRNNGLFPPMTCHLGVTLDE